MGALVRTPFILLSLAFLQMQKMMKKVSGKGGMAKMMRGMGGMLPGGGGMPKF